MEEPPAASPPPPAKPQRSMAARAVEVISIRTFKLLWRLEIRGAENFPPGGGAMVVSNHPSYLEPGIMVSLGLHLNGRQVHFMAWDKLFSVPGAAWLLRTFVAFPVNLQNPGRKPYETTLRLLREGHLVGVFPEGGRTAGPIMDVWKPGALRAASAAEVPILPVTVLGARRAFPKTAWLPRIGRKITVVIHPLATLEQLAPLAEGESEKARLGRAEAALREVIEGPIIAEKRQRQAAHLRQYRNHTPRALRWRGA